MLEHDTCLGRPDSSPVVEEGSSSDTQRARGRGEVRGKKLAKGGSAVSPPRTRCHQAQLGPSLGHQRVYRSSLFTCSAIVCVHCWETPVWRNYSLSRRIISLLNSVSLPYETHSASFYDTSLFLRTAIFVRPSSFHSAKLVAADYTAVRLLPLYAFDAIMLRPLWRLVNSANPPGGHDITEGALSRRRNVRRHARNSTKFNEVVAFTFSNSHSVKVLNLPIKLRIFRETYQYVLC